MPRFSRGARVILIETKSTGRVGTVLEILPRPELGHDFDRYRIEFTDGEIKIVADLELAPAGGEPTIEDVA